MQPPWNATAYKQGLINAGICLAAFAGVFMLLLVLAKMIFGRIELPAFLAVCGCIWVLASFGLRAMVVR